MAPTPQAQPSPPGARIGHNRCKTLVRDTLRKGKRRCHESALRSAREAAETLAIQALTFLAERPGPARRASSPRPASGRPRFARPPREPGFLAGVLDHVAGRRAAAARVRRRMPRHRPGDGRARRAQALGGAPGSGTCRDAPRFCRDCLADAARRRRAAAACGSPRLLRHARARHARPSRMSIATRSTPRSRSATIPRSPTSR